MDVLSEVLRMVRLEGALFSNAEFSAPWCLSQPRSTAIVPYLSPEAGHLIIYHFLTEGRAYFNRAFKREFDCPPAQFRRNRKTSMYSEVNNRSPDRA